MPDAYAGELPVCYVALRAGTRATEDELHLHAQRTIGERPAWPKQIHIIETLPLTSVGKIYKPQLRCDVALRLVTRVLRDQLDLADARAQVSEGGRRGMRVGVTLPQTARLAAPAVEQALARPTCSRPRYGGMTPVPAGAAARHWFRTSGSPGRARNRGLKRPSADYRICPVEWVSFTISGAMSDSVKPDALAAEFMNAVIAVAKPLVPAVGAMAPAPIIPPRDMEI